MAMTKYKKAENYLKSFLMDGEQHYEIVEDTYEYENGLMLIVYQDEAHEIESRHICVDIDTMVDCYTATEKIEQTEFDRINKLLAIESFDNYTDDELEEMGAKRNYQEGVFSIKFEDGAVLTWDLCSGDNNYWDEVNIIKDGKTTTIEDCSYSLDERMEFFADDVYYIINIIFIKEVYNGYSGRNIAEAF